MDTAIQICRGLLGLQQRKQALNDDFAPLPEEMAIEILKLLPLASVLASEWVSKPWKNLINGPHFKDAYRNKFTASFLSQRKLYGLFLKATTFANTTRKKRRVHRPRPLGLRIALLRLQTKPLPDDVMIEILQLLPFESVLACKLVSKQWKNVINGPEFKEAVCRYKFTAFIHTGGGLYGLFTRTRHDHDLDDDRRPSRFVVNHISGNILDMLPGSSEKIVCVKVDSEGASYFVHYDSFTRESYVVKDAPLQRHWRSWLGYGFGYDRRDHDHKIIVVCPISLLRFMVGSLGYHRKFLFDGFDHRTDLDNTDCNLLFAYSFRKRGWKSFKGFAHAAYDWPLGTPSGLAAAYGFNGVLHWVVSKKSLTSCERKRVLGALDLHTYTFTEIELPNAYGSGSVAELDGQLCYCAYGDKGSYQSIDLWVMKEYGVGESWTKLLDFRVDHWYMRGVTPTLLYRCGDGTQLVLFVDHFRLFRYDMDKKTIQAIY